MGIGINFLLNIMAENKSQLLTDAIVLHEYQATTIAMAECRYLIDQYMMSYLHTQAFLTKFPFLILSFKYNSVIVFCLMLE